jgi:hypothetical protein
MCRIASLLLVAASLLAADYPWSKVQELKSGAELHIYKKGASQPLNATLDEATEERLLIVLKKKQVSIPKDDIDRIEARPVVKKTPRKLAVDSTVKTTDPDFYAAPESTHPRAGHIVFIGSEFGRRVETGL